MNDSAQQQFNELIARVRGGDQQAAEQLIQGYEPQIRRIVRLKLTDARLRRALDSTDICQSVFANFFCRISMGEFDVQQPQQLLALLTTMARNKVVDRHRRESVRQPRNGKQIHYGELTHEIDTQRPAQQTPSQIVANDELLIEFEKKLTDEEYQIAKMRRNGSSWLEISATLGDSADTLRKRLSRACDRILQELGLDH